jgi:hypothetical protein
MIDYIITVVKLTLFALLRYIPYLCGIHGSLKLNSG